MSEKNTKTVSIAGILSDYPSSSIIIQTIPITDLELREEIDTDNSNTFSDPTLIYYAYLYYTEEDKEQTWWQYIDVVNYKLYKKLTLVITKEEYERVLKEMGIGALMSDKIKIDKLETVVIKHAVKATESGPLMGSEMFPLFNGIEVTNCSRLSQTYKMVLTIDVKDKVVLEIHKYKIDEETDDFVMEDGGPIQEVISYNVNDIDIKLGVVEAE